MKCSMEGVMSENWEKLLNLRFPDLKVLEDPQIDPKSCVF